MAGERRYGEFVLEESFVMGNVGLALEIFHQLKIIVVRCEMEYFDRVFRYCGVSPAFEVVPPGAMVPEYEIVVNRTEYDLQIFARRI
jgi:hypothetical protein